LGFWVLGFWGFGVLGVWGLPGEPWERGREWCATATQRPHADR
jgi:hypothetical protein